MQARSIPPRYDHLAIESRIYKLWEKSGFFNPTSPRYARLRGTRPSSTRKQSKNDTFCIIMPPPNANDPLHIGHALFVTLEDIMIRYARMRGKKALWLPGMDHAGFETQVVYEKKLEKQGRSRFQMTREEFYKEVWDYTQNNREIVRNQLKKLGASCDWSRERFTLDPAIVEIVHHTFKKMFDEGLIYRAERLVNYCTKHRTAFSELEVRHEEPKDPLYYMKYGPITLATVRPETKFGDTAIAVHPKDPRYTQYIGKELEVDTLLGKRTIKVISDEHVDPKFGTGAVKVTPAHDPDDFAMWQRHKDEIPGPLQVIGLDGRLTEKTGLYAGMKVAEARQKVSEDMQAAGLMEKIDPEYAHTVALCYKCGTVLEPMLMKQWFMHMPPLAKPAIKAVTSGEITIYPAWQKKIYFHWLKNIKDWNISRQNWWGIEIPAWRCKDCSTKENETWTATAGKAPTACRACKGKNLEQDPDVFDTWFSSTQLPYAMLLAQRKQQATSNKQQGKLPWLTKDFQTFYPTAVMETGYDIIFFWVARMVMMGLWATGKVPFTTIYLHGLVRDKDRQKMSKSKGNVIDPLGVAEMYGTDALRMALVTGTSAGRDPIVSEEKIRGYRNFATKLWNIARFLQMNLEDFSPSARITLSPKDKKIRKECDAIITKMSKYMEAYQFSQAAETCYHYIWHTFADKIIEESKTALQNKKTRASLQQLLISIFADTLKTLHPFMPHGTEDI